MQNRRTEDKTKRRGPRRAVVAALVLLGSGTWLPAARADAISWGGTVGRLQVGTWRSGFNDGWGIGGWTIEGAEAFAAWARAMSAALPAGVGLEISQEDKEPLKLLLKRCQTADPRCEHPLSSSKLETDLKGDLSDPQLQSQILSLVGKKLNTALSLLQQRQGALYTIEVFSSSDEQQANTFAERRVARDFSVEHQMYYAACLPCSIPQAHVFADQPERKKNRFVVAVGNFENQADARYALAALSRTGLRGKIRTLPKAASASE